MTEFMTALACFLLAHMIPPLPPVRRFFIGLMGQFAYTIIYSLLSLALIVWIFIAARRAPYVPLWPSEEWQVFVPLIVMPFALWFLIGGLTEPNPLSISLNLRSAQPGPMAHITRHPVLWGFLLWALSHIPPNGDLVAIILFGGMAALAAGGFWLVDRRAKQRMGEKPWQALARLSPILPFTSLHRTRLVMLMSPRVLTSGAVAIAIYLWFLLQGHLLLMGVDPLSRVRPL
jgi:uncharacterized membrane protein